VAGAINTVTQKGGVSVNLGYSYANGYSAGVSVGFGPNGTGPQVGLDWSDKNGFGASVGYGFANGVGLDVGVSQRGGTTYSASLSGKGVPVSLNYSLNVNGGKQTNTFGVSIQLPGTEHFSNVRGSLNYSDRLGLSSGVSYNIGKGDAPKPMTEAERAQYNLLDDLIGGLGSVVSGIGRGVKSVWDGVFGGEPETERALLVREQRFKDYAETYMDDGDAIAGPYGRIKDKQLQEAYGKIHDELYPQKDDGPGTYVIDGFIDPLVKAMKKMLSWSAKTGLDAMDNIKEVSGKIGDVRESLQITKPVVEDTIQLLYKEMDAARTKWRNDDQAIYDQITDLQSNPKPNESTTQKILDLMDEQKKIKDKLSGTLNSLDSQVGDLITLANKLNSGEVTNLSGAYAQIYAGLQRVSSPELSAKSQAVINLATTTQAFLVGYFNYKMTGIAATRNETGSAYAFQNYEDQQRQVLRDLWKTVMKQSNMNEKTKYVNSSGF
ncbi:hypothetical protein, partial [Leptospira ellisii]